MKNADQWWDSLSQDTKDSLFLFYTCASRDEKKDELKKILNKEEV